MKDLDALRERGKERHCFHRIAREANAAMVSPRVAPSRRATSTSASQ